MATKTINLGNADNKVNVVETGQLKVKGDAADKPIATRNIVGLNGDTVGADLYLQYGATGALHVGNAGEATFSVDGKSYSGNAATATAATTIKNTLKESASGDTYIVPFIGNSDTGNKNLYSNSGLKYYTKEGATQAEGSETVPDAGQSKLFVGTSYAAGVDKNKEGTIGIYGSNTGLTSLKTNNNTTTNNTLYLPNKNGTIAIETDGIMYAEGTGTAAVTTSPYTCTRWEASIPSITSLRDGLTIAYKVPVEANLSYGTRLKINNLGYKPVTRISTYNFNNNRYPVGSVILLVYSSKTVNNATYYNSTAPISVTGCWIIVNDSSNFTETNVNSDNNEYPILTAGAGIKNSQRTDQTYFDNEITINPNKNNITARTFTGTLKGDLYKDITYFGYDNNEGFLGYTGALTAWRDGGELILYQMSGDGAEREGGLSNKKIKLDAFVGAYEGVSAGSAHFRLYEPDDFTMYYTNIDGNRVLSNQYWDLIAYNGDLIFQTRQNDGDETKDGTSTIIKFERNGNIDANASSATVAKTANVQKKEGDATYYLPFITSLSSTSESKQLLMNTGIRYWCKEGKAAQDSTAAVTGISELGLGNNISAGTDGNRKGLIYMYGTGSGYTELIPGNNTDSHIQVNLPSKAGTVDIESATYIGTFKANEIKQFYFNSTNFASSFAKYDRVELKIYCAARTVSGTYPVCYPFSESFTLRGNHTDTDGDWINTGMISPIDASNQGYKLGQVMYKTYKNDGGLSIWINKINNETWTNNTVPTIWYELKFYMSSSLN